MLAPAAHGMRLEEEEMKKQLALALIGVAMAFSAASQEKKESAKKELTPQQMLMKTCQADATASGKKGKDRQEMVNSCLADGKKRQQEKMKACAAENKGKKGDEYKKAQAECLRK
jgi:hypothetical protein